MKNPGLPGMVLFPNDSSWKTVLNSARSILYAVSDSGVMVLPVGSLTQYPRVKAVQEDILVQSNFCNRNSVVQTLNIVDPGGNHTDFGIVASQPGVSFVASSGVTPATVQVRVNPALFANTNGTTVVPITITSSSAINQPRQVRLLIRRYAPPGKIISIIVSEWGYSALWTGMNEQKQAEMLAETLAGKQVATRAATPEEKPAVKSAGWSAVWSAVWSRCRT